MNSSFFFCLILVFFFRSITNSNVLYREHIFSALKNYEAVLVFSMALSVVDRFLPHKQIYTHPIHHNYNFWSIWFFSGLTSFLLRTKLNATPHNFRSRMLKPHCHVINRGGQWIGMNNCHSVLIFLLFFFLLFFVVLPVLAPGIRCSRIIWHVVRIVSISRAIVIQYIGQYQAINLPDITCI